MAAAGEVVVLLASWVLTTGLSFVVVVLDERRLPPARLARAWPETSRNAALIAFGPLAVPFHFARTRGHLGSPGGGLGALLGAALGLIAGVLVVAVSSVCVSALAHVLAIPD